MRRKGGGAPPCRGVPIAMLKRFKRPAAGPVSLQGPDTVDGRCFQDWLAGLAGKVEEGETHVRFGARNYIRTYLLTAYPEGEARLGRLDRLLTFMASDKEFHRVQVRVTHHLVPSVLPDNFKTRWLRNRQMGMVADGQERGTPDPATSKALKAYTDIWNAVASHDDVVFEFWIGITLIAEDLQVLDRMGHRLHAELGALSLAATPLFKEQIDGARFSHILGHRQDALMRAVPGRMSHSLPLSYLHPLQHGSINEGTGVYVAHELDELGLRHATYVDFTRGAGAMNWALAGMSGEGKSTWLKAVIVGLLLEGFQVIVYDANGEYKALTDALGGLHVDLTASSGNYYEPLIIPPASGDPNWDRGRFAQMSQLFHCLLRALAPDLTPKERSVADHILIKTLADAGIKADDPASWDRPARLLDWYRNLKAHPSEDLTAELISKIAMYFEGSQPLFRQAQKAKWGDAQLVRIAISDVVSTNAADEQVAGVKTLLANHCVWNEIVRNRHQGLRYVMVVLDEGQRVLRHEEMAEHFYQVATDGRKFNAGLSIAANDINVFLETQGGQGMWENATLRVLFHMADSGLRRARENAAIPETVLDQLREMSGTYEYMMTRDTRKWTRGRLQLPEAELSLYHTRGLKVRKEGAS